MIELQVLPPCSLRGGRYDDGLYQCASVFLVHSAGAADPETCKVCPYVNWTCEDRPEHALCKHLAAKRNGEPPLPPLASQVAGFLASVSLHLLNGLPQVDDDVRERRVALCLACEEHRPSDGRCAKCGCHALIKARWQSEKCPIGKW